MATPCILVKGDFDAFFEFGILANGFLRLSLGLDQRHPGGIEH